MLKKETLPQRVCVGIQDFEPLDLSEAAVHAIAIEQNRTVAIKPSLKCTGRGTTPSKPIPLLQMKLPNVVVQSMKESQSKGRGRGRGSAIGVSSNSVTRTPYNSSQKTVPTFMLTTPTSHTHGAAPTNTPLKEVLATANDRFKSYGILKHNPARAVTSPIIKSSLNVNSVEQFPSLPTMDYTRFRPPSSTETGSINSTTASWEKERYNHKTNTASLKMEKSDMKETSMLVTENVAAQIDALFEGLRGSNEISKNPFAQSTPLVTPQKNSTADLYRLPPTPIRDDASNPPAGLTDTVPPPPALATLEHHHTVRIENLPVSVRQCEVEEIIAPYGQVLDLKLELRICGGEEMLSADIVLADESIAEYVVSCLDGADTIFEGTHDPVRCYIQQQNDHCTVQRY